MLSSSPERSSPGAAATTSPGRLGQCVHGVGSTGRLLARARCMLHASVFSTQRMRTVRDEEVE